MASVMTNHDYMCNCVQCEAKWKLYPRSQEQINVVCPDCGGYTGSEWSLNPCKCSWIEQPVHPYDEEQLARSYALHP